MNPAEINQILNRALQDRQARPLAQKALNLDDANWNYFFTLFQRKKAGTSAESPMVLNEAGQDLAGKRVAYSVSEAPEELLTHLRKVSYDDIAKPENIAAAQSITLWIKKMQAGSGSSMTRKSYLAKKMALPESEIRIGAKGTDLFVSTPQGEIPLVEALILQSIEDIRQGKYKEIVLHDILSSETQAALHKIWKSPCLLDPSRTYAEYINQTPGLSRFRETFQSYIPTLDESGAVSFNRTAPGGHALFGVDALRAAYLDELRPNATPLVSSLSNGEDMSACPDPAMVGYIVREKIAIALVTTEKTPVDMKGGILALVKSPQGEVSLGVLETAQAKEAGQLKVFEAAKGSINTNMAIFNYEVLTPLIRNLVAEVGEDEFMRIITPDLISNVKEQKDADGVKRKYTQLEGAMGSSLMNLDRYWRRRHGQPLVHVIDIDRMKRTDFFSPIKSAFDYFMQFHSDRFNFDTKAMRLKNLRPGSLPLIELVDPAYQDVQTVLDAFYGASIVDLDYLKIEGPILLARSKLQGRVSILNRSDKTADLSGISVANQRIEFDADGKLTRSDLSS